MGKDVVRSSFFDDAEVDFDGNTSKSKEQEFIEKWKNRGYEKGETQLFWLELLELVQKQFPTDINIKNLDIKSTLSPEERVRVDGTTKFIDLYIGYSKTLIEQKSSDISLSEPQKQSDGEYLTPYQQAKRYAENMAYSKRPRWIVTSNFREIWVYDEENPETGAFKINLADIEKYWSALKVLIHPWGDSLRLIEEKEVSYQAGTLIGELYDGFKEAYDRASNNSEYFYDLNVLCVRIVFCLFAENTSLFGKGAFRHFLKRYAGDPEELGIRLNELFKVLDTPYESRGAMIEELRQFPYVDGGLFKDNIRIPRFDFALSSLLIQKCSEEFNWSGVNPTIFGAIFESTLNPETRRQNGMHYTSVENIHKVIDPLFLDELELELVDVLKTEGTREEKVRAVEKYRRKLGRLTFLDPACGSGNFLTETFCSLRRLENICLRKLDELGELDRIEAQGDDYLEAELKSRIRLDNFYGIEINSFACTVARAALWIAEEKMYLEYEGRSAFKTSHLPLQDTSNNIVKGNSLRLNWGEIVSKEDLNYIIGNPPFVGSAKQSKEQKNDLKTILGSVKNTGKLDYVSLWFYKAIVMAQGTGIEIGLVSSDIMFRGETVGTFWGDCVINNGLICKIKAGYKKIKWTSESTDAAGVDVSIACIYCDESKEYIKKLDYNGTLTPVDKINFYLLPAEDVFIGNLKMPVDDKLPIHRASVAADGGYLTLNEQAFDELASKYPDLWEYSKEYYSPKEHFSSLKKCRILYFEGLSREEVLERFPDLSSRIYGCGFFRAGHDSLDKYSDCPHLLKDMESFSYVTVVPRSQSSVCNGHILADVLEKEGIYIYDAFLYIDSTDLKYFGLLSSRVFTSWAKFIKGEQYGTIITVNSNLWNSFIFPKDCNGIRVCAKAILDYRKKHSDIPLKELYKDGVASDKLISLLHNLDHAVMDAYNFKHPDGTYFNDDEILSGLISLYKEAIDKERSQQ